MAPATLKIEDALFLVTMDPRRRIIRGGTVLVEGQRIAGVGKAELFKNVPADRVIDAREMVVTPGLCNGHLHASYAHATRGVFPDDLGPDYLPTVFRLQAAMDEREEYLTSLLAITELLKYGTTCFLDPGSTKHLDACMEAYRESGCRVIVGRHVTDRDNPLGLPVYSTDEAISLTEETIRRYDGRLDGRMRAWAMPFSAGFASRELLAGARQVAAGHGTGMTLHHSYSRLDADAWTARHGGRPVHYLEEAGVLGPDTLLAHGLGLDQSEVDLLAATETSVVVCPTAALKGGAGMTNTGMLPEMLEAGVTVGLGTDAGNNSNLLETLRSVYLVAVLYKDAREDVSAVPAETALEMATIGGARALGLDGEIGSIETGKRADMVLFDTRRPEWRTLFDPVNSLVYAADGRSVHTVVVDGRVVVEDHKPLFVDEWELIRRVQEIGEDMLARTGVAFPGRWPVE